MVFMGTQPQHEGVVMSRLQKLDRPILTTGCSQQGFGFFKDEWRRYATSAGTEDDAQLQDQLLHCEETGLRKTLQNTIRPDKMSTITVPELVEEIGKAAVEKQFNVLNKVKLMEAQQEHDEPIRKFVARLRGLASICILSTECPAENEILSKVKQMDLDETVAFVEARETGKHDPVLHGGGPLASQANGV